MNPQRVAGSVCVVAILKGEEAFLDEWLAYHRLIGVRHFYLYDNDPALPLRRFLAPHAAYVTVIDWPGEREHMPGHNKQTKAYTDSLARIREEWVAFIDGDEFIVLREHISVVDFVQRFSRTDMILLDWHLFGPNGHHDNPPGLVTRALTRRQRMPARMTKSITRVDAIGRINTPHLCRLKRWRLWARTVDANGRDYRPEPYPGKTDVAHINHYLCRSYVSWMARLERGAGSFARPVTHEKHVWRFDRTLLEAKFHRIVATMHEVEDTWMLRFGDRIERHLDALPGLRAARAPVEG